MSLFLSAALSPTVLSSVLSYIIFILLSIHFPDFMITHRPLIVYLALPWSNLGACRSIISLFIAMERVLIVYCPLKYQLIRPKLPNPIILSIGVIFGLSEWPVLFVFCDYQMDFLPTCRVFGCAMNRCFYNFWTGHKAVSYQF